MLLNTEKALEEKHKMNYLCSSEIIDYKQIKYERNDKDARVSL